METAAFTLQTLAKFYLRTGDERILRSINLCVNEWMRSRLQYRGQSFFPQFYPRFDNNAHRALKHNSYTPVFFMFDNGEAVRGIVYTYDASKDPAQIQLASEIADWLTGVMQNPDGSFKTNYDLFYGKFNTYPDVKPVYHARVAWSLLELWRRTGIEQARDDAIRALDYVGTQQHENGWFETIGGVSEYLMYAAEGLYYSGRILGNALYTERATKTIKAFMVAPHMNKGHLHGSYDEKWQPTSTNGSFNSVDGQLAVMCYNLYSDNGDVDFLEEGDSCLEWLIRQQDRISNDGGMHGGIPNAIGETAWHTRYPIWTVKYLIDAIDLRLQLKSK